jgi:hypothetical protein
MTPKNPNLLMKQLQEKGLRHYVEGLDPKLRDTVVGALHMVQARMRKVGLNVPHAADMRKAKKLKNKK